MLTGWTVEAAGLYGDTKTEHIVILARRLSTFMSFSFFAAEEKIVGGVIDYRYD